MVNGHMLHVVLRTCTRVHALHGGKRPLAESKSELTLACLNSLLDSLGAEGVVHVLDDHSPEEDVADIKKLLASYGNTHQFIALSETGNGNSIEAALNYARDKKFPLIYFCEDDYLHLPHAIPSMLDCYGRFKAIVHPVDYFDRYANMHQSHIYLGAYNYWRTIFHTTFTIMVSEAVLDKYFDTYLKLAELHKNGPGYGSEDKTINTVYAKELCLSPLPSLAAHVSPEPPLPPFIDWLEVYRKNHEEVGRRLGKGGKDVVPATKETASVKPHVLFITEEEKFGAWYFPYNMWDSLDAAGLATTARFHHDAFFERYGYSGDEELIRQCKQRKPDIIVFRTFYFDGVRGPTTQTLLYLHHTLHIPMATFYPDSHLVDTSFLNSLAQEKIIAVMLDYSDLHAKHPATMLSFSPYDTRRFKDTGRTRDIDVCFIGTIEGGHADRQVMIDALKRAGISVVTGGSNLDERKKIPLDQYIETLQRAKISLNFSKAGNDLPQLKGRVFETMFCGAMLFEQTGAATPRLFKEEKEYVSFNEVEDLVEKVRYYLAHDMERKAIASAGQKAALEKYNPAVFWNALFKKAGISVN